MQKLSGVYRYSCNDKVQKNINEAFVIENGVTCAWRTAGDISMFVIARPDRFNIVWNQGEDSIRADYEPREFLRQINREAFEGESLPDLHRYPLMRIFTGNMIRHIADQGGEAQVIVPNIRPETGRTDLLKPIVSSRRVVQLDCDDVDQTAWQIIGDQYDETTRFWLNAENRLTRYQWQQTKDKRWTVELELNPDVSLPPTFPNLP